MSRRAVYRLLPRAPAFAAAFEAAMSRVTATLADTLFDRALHGHEVPVMYKGDVVAPAPSTTTSSASPPPIAIR